jgi:CDP-L-myo-inositol myo-inositolphosphotransferase
MRNLRNAKSRQIGYLVAVPVTAVILAAGKGRRLGGRAKPLAVVGGVTLLERTVATACAAGIPRIVVVVESLDGPVAAFCRSRLKDVELVCAHDRDRGNGASVVAGLAYAGGRCLVMMVDHLQEPSTVKKVLEADGDLVLAVDSRAAYVDADDATLVRRDGDAVVEVAKKLSSYDAIEAGLAACSAEQVLEIAARLDGDLEFNRLKGAWLEAGRSIGTVDIDGAFWADIDTQAERRRAIGDLVRHYGRKDSDGPVARLLNRQLSTLVSRRLLATRLGPHPVTLANLALLVLSGTLLALGAHEDTLLIAGGILVQLSSALDGVDGELARVSGRTSPFGAVLDAVCDRYGDLAVLIGAAVGAGTDAAWPWALGAVVASWQLSFLRREHERIAGELPASHVRWQWSRDVRLLVLALTCILLQPLWGLAAWAVLGNVDALRRLTALVRVSR